MHTEPTFGEYPVLTNNVPETGGHQTGRAKRVQVQVYEYLFPQFQRKETRHFLKWIDGLREFEKVDFWNVRRQNQRFIKSYTRAVLLFFLFLFVLLIHDLSPFEGVKQLVDSLVNNVIKHDILLLLVDDVHWLGKVRRVSLVCICCSDGMIRGIEAGVLVKDTAVFARWRQRVAAGCMV